MAALPALPAVPQIATRTPTAWSSVVVPRLSLWYGRLGIDSTFQLKLSSKNCKLAKLVAKLGKLTNWKKKKKIVRSSDKGQYTSIKASNVTLGKHHTPSGQQYGVSATWCKHLKPYRSNWTAHFSIWSINLIYQSNTYKRHTKPNYICMQIDTRP